MSVRIQIILDEEDVTKFKSEAVKESKSLSAWLRDAGRNALERKKGGPMADPGDLRAFFKKCGEKEQGKEPDWDEHKRLITQGMKEAGPQP